MIKIKKGTPLIDQHDKNGYWGGKFGGNFIPETLKKPVEDLAVLFEKLRKDKKFIKESQKLYKKQFPEKRSDHVDVQKIWNEITTETGFYEKYQ